MTYTRDRNPNWKGGRTKSSHGYILVRVHPEHHLADCRGYAYEHRLIAENIIGRRLHEEEHVHHKNGDKSDNRPENLEVTANCAEHLFLHRSSNSTRRLPNEPNPKLSCKCGCGIEFDKYDISGRPRSYVTGHNPQSAPESAAILTLLRDGPLTRHEIAKRRKKNVRTIATALSKLKRTNLAVQVAQGVWADKKLWVQAMRDKYQIDTYRFSKDEWMAASMPEVNAMMNEEFSSLEDALNLYPDLAGFTLVTSGQDSEDEAILNCANRMETLAELSNP